MMYDPHAVLAQMDAHKFAIIAFCGAAMAFNYTWFYQAVRAGFRDQVFPVPIVNTLFWLCGDGTGVARYHMYFVQYDHWYLRLFWAALVVTVSFEILFIAMTLRFGRKELCPDWPAARFAALMGVAAAIFGVSWNMVLGAMPDDLNIVYFNIANMMGPIAMTGLIMRRGSIAGTRSAIWINYTLMVVFWYVAQAEWFGPEFRGSRYSDIHGNQHRGGSRIGCLCQERGSKAPHWQLTRNRYFRTPWQRSRTGVLLLSCGA